MSNHKQIDFSAPRRMSPQALIVMLCSLFNFRSLITIAIFLIGAFAWGEKRGINSWLLIGILTAASILLPTIRSIIHYCSLRYWIAGGLLHLSHGWLSKQKLTIPLSRIHSLSSESNIWYQATDMVGLKIDTKATENVELDLILTQEEYDTLYQVISEQEQTYLESSPMGYENHPSQGEEHAPTPKEGIPISTETETDQTPTTLTPQHQSIQYRLIDLIHAGLTSNHLKGFCFIAYVVYKVFEETRSFLPDSVVIQKAIEYGTSLGHSPQVMKWIEDGITVVIGLVLVILASAIIQTTVYVWRYWQAELKIAPHRLIFSRGLSTRVKQTVRRKQAVSITFKTNILERILGCKTLQVELAKGVLSSKEDSRFKLRGWRDMDSILQWWQVSDQEVLPKAQSKWYIFRYYLVLGLLAALPLGGMIVWLSHRDELSIYFLTLTLIPLLIGAGYGYSYYRLSSIKLTPRHLYVSLGGWRKLEVWIPYDAIGKTSINQAIWQRRTDSCSLEISTLGGSYRLPALNRREASELHNALLYIIEM